MVGILVCVSSSWAKMTWKAFRRWADMGSTLKHTAFLCGWACICMNIDNRATTQNTNPCNIMYNFQTSFIPSIPWQPSSPNFLFVSIIFLNLLLCSPPNSSVPSMWHETAFPISPGSWLSAPFWQTCVSCSPFYSISLTSKLKQWLLLVVKYAVMSMASNV